MKYLQAHIHFSGGLRLFAAACVLACSLFPFAAGVSAQGHDDPVVATVNNEKIFESEVFTRLQRLKAQDFILKPKPLTMRSDSAGSVVLSSIINEHIIIQLTRKENVVPTEAAVQAQAEPILAQENVKKMIDAHLITAGQLAYDIRVQDSRRNLEKKLGNRAAAEKSMAAFRQSSQITIALPGYESLANSPK